MEVKRLGKLSCVGNVTCETKDLFTAEPQAWILTVPMKAFYSNVYIFSGFGCEFK